MSCPTCSATMQAIHAPDECPMWWCPRCGTVKTMASQDGVAPSLVKCCRTFEKTMASSYSLLKLWKRLGIAEAINTPENRP